MMCTTESEIDSRISDAESAATEKLTQAESASISVNVTGKSHAVQESCFSEADIEVFLEQTRDHCLELLESHSKIELDIEIN